MTTSVTTRSMQANAFTGWAQTAARLVMVIALMAVTTTANSAESKPDAKPENKLVGTWKMVSAKYGGEVFNIGEGLTTFKHVTPSQFMWVTYDKDGKVTRTAGGSYTIKGEAYDEVPEYGLSADFDVIKGKAQTFKWKVEGNKWYH